MWTKYTESYFFITLFDLAIVVFILLPFRDLVTNLLNTQDYIQVDIYSIVLSS